MRQAGTQIGHRQVGRPLGACYATGLRCPRGSASRVGPLQVANNAWLSSRSKAPSWLNRLLKKALSALRQAQGERKSRMKSKRGSAHAEPVEACGGVFQQPVKRPFSAPKWARTTRLVQPVQPRRVIAREREQELCAMTVLREGPDVPRPVASAGARHRRLSYAGLFKP